MGIRVSIYRINITAKVINLAEYKKNLIDPDECTIFNLLTEEPICVLPSRIIDVFQSEHCITVKCDDGNYIVYPDGSYESVDE